MQTFGLLLDMPVTPLVLRALLDGEGKDEHDLISELSHSPGIPAAIRMLVEQGLIRRTGARLKLVRDGDTRRRIDQIVAFYEKVDSNVRRKLLFRGILNTTQYKCLVREKCFMEMMEHEGASRADVDQLIDENGKQGCVERMTVAYRIRQGMECRPLPSYRWYYKY
jgi:hypothetical protein